MTDFHKVLLSGVAALALTGCASTAGPHADVPRDLITRDMLQEARASGSMTALDAIRRYRPIWLRTQRGQDSFYAQGRRGVRVYFDDVQYGGVASLRDLDVETIEEMRFLDKREATMKFGTDHAEGAIMIVSRRGGG